MRAAKGLAVVEQKTAVQRVQTNHGKSEILGQKLANGTIEGCVTGQVGRCFARAVCESGAVVQGSTRGKPPGKPELETGSESIALIVVEKKISGLGWREIGQAATDGARAFRVRMRVRQANRGPAEQRRRTQGCLPPA